MPVSEAFDPVDHLQKVSQKTLNRMVREFFLDQPDLDDLDITTPRGALKMACSHRPEDSMLVTVQRSLLFHLTVGQIGAAFPAVYGIPCSDFDQTRKYRPQITLYFQEDDDEVEGGYSPVRGEINFRLMSETSETISRAELVRLGQKIKTEFGGAGGYQWRKGKLMASYTDRTKGYKLQLLCRDKAGARALVDKVLDIQGHAVDLENFKVIETENASTAYPTLPPQKTILGKSQRMPRRRPIATVKFRYATASVWGQPRPVMLYDRTGFRREALVSP